MKFSTLTVDRPYLKVADQILDLIKTQQLTQGSKLPSERTLATEFNVSRPTIREAMVALELANLIEVKTASGVYLKQAALETTPSLLAQGASALDISQAQQLIEAQACALAAEHISDEQLAQLSALLDEVEHQTDPESSLEQLVQAFHCLIAKASANRTLEATVQWLWQLRENSQISVHFQQRIRMDGIRPIIEAHRAIMLSLQSRDANAAHRAMHDHIQVAINHLTDHEN